MKNELVQALGNCKNQLKCNCLNKESIEVVAATQFYIIDNADTTQPVSIGDRAENWQLEVRNPLGKELYLVKLDNCLLTTHQSRKCDCIVCGPAKCCLVEIKTATDKTRKERRKDALQQLGATVEMLKGHGIEPARYNTLAIVCFKNNRPVIVNAASSAARASFLSQYGIPLEEKNTLEF